MKEESCLLCLRGKYSHSRTNSSIVTLLLATLIFSPLGFDAILSYNASLLLLSWATNCFLHRDIID